jgi:futalosine hydrolase
MNLLVVASTQMEIAPFLSQPLPKHCDILISGVGVPSTSYLLTRQLLHHHYDLVIQAGVAGSSNEEIGLGATVLVTKDAFADLGAFEEGSFKSTTDMELSHELEWIVNPHQHILDKFPLRKVSGITVNMVTDHEEVLNALQAKWGKPDIESMEGAVLHYVCHHLEKKFVQLRAISNRVGERNKEHWKMAEAVEQLNVALSKMVHAVLDKK